MFGFIPWYHPIDIGQTTLDIQFVANSYVRHYKSTLFCSLPKRLLRFTYSWKTYSYTLTGCCEDPQSTEDQELRCCGQDKTWDTKPQAVQTSTHHQTVSRSTHQWWTTKYWIAFQFLSGLSDHPLLRSWCMDGVGMVIAVLPTGYLACCIVWLVSSPKLMLSLNSMGVNMKIV